VQVLDGAVQRAAASHLNFFRLWHRFGLIPEIFHVKQLGTFS
jgi:hypothetical protein